MALVADAGVEPGSDLQQLHQRILNANPDLTAPTLADADEPAVLTGPATPLVPRQLPAAVPHFAGRMDALATLDRLMEPATGTGGAVISVIGGTAGAGKTALAVRWAHQVAERFPDGQLYVNLRGFGPSDTPMTSAEAICGFLDALQVPAGQIPTETGARVGLYRSLLAGRRMLVVLDNARDADQVRPLLPGSPGCVVLVTSRSQLAGLIAAEGASVLTLDVLSGAEARALLAGRLGTARIEGEPEAVADLADACARLPLALSIVAARATTRPGFPLSALAVELRRGPNPLDRLDTGDPVTSIRAVFSWSYEDLDAAAARMSGCSASIPGRTSRLRQPPAWPTSHWIRHAGRSPNLPALTSSPSTPQTGSSSMTCCAPMPPNSPSSATLTPSCARLSTGRWTTTCTPATPPRRCWTRTANRLPRRLLHLSPGHVRKPSRTAATRWPGSPPSTGYCSPSSAWPPR
jgi:NB-ARC domain